MPKYNLNERNYLTITNDNGTTKRVVISATYSSVSLGCFHSSLGHIVVSGASTFDNKLGLYTYEDLSDVEITDELVKICAEYVIALKGREYSNGIIIGGPMNYGTPNKLPAPPYEKIILNTPKFVEYLVKNKRGIVVATPIFKNANHNYEGNFSLCQVWFWIPPGKEHEVIQGTGGIYNEEAMVPREEFAKHTPWKTMEKVEKQAIPVGSPLYAKIAKNKFVRKLMG